MSPYLPKKNENCSFPKIRICKCTYITKILYTDNTYTHPEIYQNNNNKNNGTLINYLALLILLPFTIPISSR